MRIISSIIISLLFFLSSPAQDTSRIKSIPIHQVITEEVIQTTMYTYLRVKEDTSTYWLAVPKMEARPGETYFHLGGMEMRNFESKELKRTFPSVFFMDYLSSTPQGTYKKESNAMGHGKRPQKVKRDIHIPLAEGGITIADLFGNKEKYAGKEVIIRGQVVKFNDGILGHNWVHLQDGSIFKDEYELTITTSATVRGGDITTFKGKISLNKDFGSGYFFNVLMEDAIIVK